MNIHRQLRKPLLVAVFAIVTLTLGAADALASHFRYGSISWTVPNPTTAPRTVVIRFDAAWRWQFDGWFKVTPPATFQTINPLQITPGTVITAQTAIGIQGPNGQYAIRIFNGPTLVATYPVHMTVTGIDNAADVMNTTMELTHTFTAAGQYRIVFEETARLSNLVGPNADDPFIISAMATVATAPFNRQPVAATLPIMNVLHNTIASFTVPAYDPDGNPLTFSIPTTAESGLTQVAPPGFSIHPTTGVVTWNTAGSALNGLYAVQIRVADDKGAYTVVDLLVRPVTAVGQPPSVLINGAPSNASPAFNVVRNTPLNFSVTGVDPEGAPVTLTSSPLPPGASMTPSLPTTAPANVSSSFFWIPGPNQVGTYVINYSAIDGNGLQGTGSATINVTNNPPTIMCVASGGTIEATGPGGANFSVTSTLADADDDLLTQTLLIDGVVRATNVGVNPPLSVPVTRLVGLGDHTYEVRVTDNLSAPVSCTGTFSIVDTTAPSLSLPDNIVVDGTGPQGAFVNYTVSANDSVDPAPTVVCEHSPGFFSYGLTTVACVARDASNNVTPGMFTVTVNDPSAPVVGYSINGTAGNDGWYRSDVTVNWTVSDPDSGIDSTVGCDPQIVDIDTASVDFTCTATNGTGVSTTVKTPSIKRDATAPTIAHAVATIVAEATSAAGAVVTYVDPGVGDNLSGVDTVSCNHASGATFALGVTTVTCTVTDKAGNSSAADLSIEVRDTIAPAIDALIGNTFEATSPAGAALVYGTPSASDAVDASVTVACTPAAGATIGFSTVTVTCTATDDSGNSSSTSASFVAVDTTPPTIGALANLTQPGTNPAGEVMNWAATATDIVSGDVAVTCTPASGSVFGYAVTPVTCTATDAAGNTATSAFTVEITDATPPQINVAVVGTLGNNNWYTSDVTVTWAVADAQSPVTATGCDATTINADGSVTLTCSATSAGGSASQSITIKRDAAAPALMLPASFSALATATTGAVVTYTASANDASSDLASFACAPASGSLFAIGATAVTCTATDNAGLSATGVFTITVNDTIPPVITSTTPSVNSLWPPNHQMVPVTVTVAATDNLGPAPVCTVSSVTSNEPQNGLGDGDTPNDWLLTGGLTLQLRAERAGRGDGRIYTVRINCVDGSGNATTSSTTVTVPKSQSR